VEKVVKDASPVGRGEPLPRLGRFLIHPLDVKDVAEEVA
jgi:hypothetical protein